MRRTLLLVLLGSGVFAGYGSAIASARWHARHHGGCGDRWSQHHRFDREAPPPAVTHAPAPAPIVVPQAAAAPAPQVFVITVPGAAPAAAPQVVPVPAAQAAPAPAPATPSTP